MKGAYGGNYFNVLAEPPAEALRRLRPGYRVIDRSRIGDTAWARLAFFIRTPIATRFVVIQYGVNDAGSGYLYARPLKTMVTHVQRAGKTAIVTGPSRGAIKNWDTYHDIARKVAMETGAAFADWGAVEFSQADMGDPIHPGQAYSLRLVRQLVATLDRLAPECMP